ncbi:MAG: hypothetical protein R2844_19820 [Caldilineales bacterium]
MRYGHRDAQRLRGVWQNITASLFTGLVGLSMTLNYNNARQRQPDGHAVPPSSSYAV